MHNPFLLHPQQLRQSWKDIRTACDGSMDLISQLQLVSDFWNKAPTSRPFLDYLDTSAWPDPWTLLDSRVLDSNSLSLGMFYTLLLSSDHRVDENNLRLCMMRQPNISWEGMVCMVDDRYLMGYDRLNVVDISLIPDLLVMHTYKYDLRKRCIVEILQSARQLHSA